MKYATLATIALSAATANAQYYIPNPIHPHPTYYQPYNNFNQPPMIYAPHSFGRPQVNIYLQPTPAYPIYQPYRSNINVVPQQYFSPAYRYYR